MFAVLKLNFKAYNFTTKAEKGNTLIFDIIRKKFVVLTPEEWVRQHLIRYLTDELQVPAGLISVERRLQFNGLMKRFDIAVANSTGKMTLLVECKAPHVKISSSTLRQAGVYQKSLGVQKILLSNGLHHVFLEWDGVEAKFRQVEQFQPFHLWP